MRYVVSNKRFIPILLANSCRICYILRNVYRRKLYAEFPRSLECLAFYSFLDAAVYFFVHPHFTLFIFSQVRPLSIGV